MKESYALVLNEGYVTNNQFYRSTTKQEHDETKIYSIEGSNYLLYKELKPQLGSIFKTISKKPTYHKLSIFSILDLLLYLQENDYFFYISDVGSQSSLFNELTTELRDYFLPKMVQAKKENNQVAYENLVEELKDEYDYDYINTFYLSFNQPLVSVDGKKKQITFKLYSSSVLYPDIFNENIAPQVIEDMILKVYRIVMKQKLKLSPVEYLQKKIVPHGYAHLSNVLDELNQLITTNDGEKVLNFLKEHEKDLKIMNKAFEDYRGKTKEV